MTTGYGEGPYGSMPYGGLGTDDCENLSFEIGANGDATCWEFTYYSSLWRFCEFGLDGDFWDDFEDWDPDWSSSLGTTDSFEDSFEMAWDDAWTPNITGDLFADDFESNWGTFRWSHDLVQPFSYAGFDGSLADPPEPENHEDFEEGWHDNENWFDNIDWTDPNYASTAVFDTTPEDYEDFEEEWALTL